MPVKVRRVDFSADEWLAGTASLSNDERGLYITACALIYSRGGAIEIDELRRCSRDHGNSFNRQLKHLVALHKLSRNGREIDQKRCEKELEKSRKRAEKGRELAEERWKNNDVKDAAAMQPRNGNLEPRTRNQEPGKKKPPHTGSPPPQPAEHTAPDGANVQMRSVEKSNVRGTRLAPDWQPSAADCEFAVAHGLDPGQVADEFADYWRALTGAKATKRDWPATWRNWCRRQQQPGRQRSEPVSFLAALRRVRLAGDC
jgi:uncharacterized protein YdaU (DUF1376 family)